MIVTPFLTVEEEDEFSMLFGMSVKVHSRQNAAVQAVHPAKRHGPTSTRIEAYHEDFVFRCEI